MSHKSRCDSCGEEHRNRGLLFYKGYLLCHKCRLKINDFKILNEGPIYSFEDEMNKIHIIKEFSQKKKGYKNGKYVWGYCNFSKFLHGQHFILRNKFYEIKRQNYFPKELIGTKFRLNSDKLEVIEINEN